MNARLLWCLCGWLVVMGVTCEPAPRFQSECSDNSDCDATEFCAGGLCEEGVGLCIERPTSCNDRLDPHCGCDGETYLNLCSAQAAGVRVLLATGCLCDSDEQCGEGKYCESDEVCEMSGSCNFVPESCEDDIDPVCGCDGATYLNECSARAAGMSIADLGNGCECQTDGECGAGSYCDLGEDCGAPGNCSFGPKSCEGERMRAACGCDGITYENDCVVRMMEIGVLDHNDGCECDSNDDCGEGQFCLLGSDCGTESPGTCDFRPLTCSGQVFETVCGCDDMTYDSECAANLAGVSAASEGACP